MSEPHVVETHISWLVFTGSHVYKIKRPIRFGFVDLTDVSDRTRACEAEVRLNSRLAADVYVGVQTFHLPDGTCEPCVVMRRLPDERRLAVLVARDDGHTAGYLRSVAKELALFHASADRGEEIDEACSAEAIAELWRDNLAELRELAADSLDPSDLDLADAHARLYLAGRADLFSARVASGHVVDGHGDLLADDIFCLDDGPRLLDCLEFDSRLRWVDVLYDVASLAMDLERLGRPDLASAFTAFYKDHTGDDWPDSLAHYYMAYRAMVRAKVSLLGSRLEESRRLVDLATRHLEAATVKLVLVGGLPGSGKSTIATRLQEATKWPLLQSDAVRKELAGLDPLDHTPAPYGGGMYTAEAKAAVYAEMIDRARGLLRTGDSVIVDASWTRGCWREAARDLALQCHAELVQIRCETSRNLATLRIGQRGHEDLSDATAEIADAMATAQEPWLDALPLDTSYPIEESIERALALVGPPG